MANRRLDAEDVQIAGGQRGPRRALAGLLLVYLALAGLYHLTVPLWEAPDAVWHYAFVAHLARGGGLPTRADQGLEAPWRQQGSQPPLYYLLSAPVVAAIDTRDEAEVMRFNPHAAVGMASPGGNINRLIHTHREAFPWRGTALAAHLVGLLGIGWGTLAILATYAAARAAFPSQPSLALAAAGLLALNPQFIFMAGAINNDIAVTAAGAICLWRLAALVRSGPSRGNCLYLGLAFGIALLSKLSALWLGPPLVAALAWASWQAAREPPAVGRADLPARLGRLAESLAWFGVPALVVAGWWFLRNFLLFGDPTGLPLMLNVMQPRAAPPSLRELAIQLIGVWKSYWAVFGWFNLPAPDGVYWLVSGLSLLALAGLAVGVAGRRAEMGAVGLATLAWAGAVVLSLFVGLVAWAQVRYPQGRLLFPAAPAFALILAAGLTFGLPAAKRERLTTACLGLLAILGAWLWLTLLRPAYQPRAILLTASAPSHAPSPTAVPARSNPGSPTISRAAERPVDRRLRGWALGKQPADSIAGAPRAEFGGQLALHHAEVIAGPVVQPGQAITVNLLWAAARPPSRDYSIFVHLLDEHDLILAQRDSFPQSGLAPTSEWLPLAGGAPALVQPGDVLYPDVHPVLLPPTIGIAADARLILGVYDAATGARLRTTSGADYISLARLRIEPRVDREGIPNPLDVRWGDAIHLVGFELDRREVKAGRKLHLTLYWRTERRLKRDYKVSLQLRRPNGEIWAQTDEEPDDSRRPTSTWSPGELIRDYHSLAVHESAPAGVYQLYLKLYDPQRGHALAVDYRNTEMPFGLVLVRRP